MSIDYPDNTTLIEGFLGKKQYAANAAMELTMKFEAKEPTHRALSSHGDSFEDLVTMDALITTYSQRS